MARQLTPSEQDALEEAIDRQVYKLHKTIGAMFGTPLSPEEMRYAKAKIRQGVMQAMSQDGQQPGTGGGQPAPQPPQPPVDPNVSLAPYAEGGFINDASGQATQRERQRLGIQ